MTGRWSRDDMPDLTGRVAIVTGANSGLGLESTRALARRGATVVMGCRDLGKAEAAKADVLREVPAARLEVLPLDNASLGSIRRFADAFAAKKGRLDILMNNAGVMAIPRAETEDGFEMQLGVNHLGHFALTGLLLGVLTRTPAARVHTISSSAHYSGDVHFGDLMLERSYGRWKAYGQSKLANVFFANELQRRLAAAGHDTLSNSSHPGFVLTNLQATSLARSGAPLAERVLYRTLVPLLAQDVEAGVLPQLYGATAPEARGGAFYGPKTLHLKGPPAEKKAKRDAYDAGARARLWAASEELTGVTYDFGRAPRTAG